MKISFSQLPHYPWWGHGTPAYENNLAMKVGNTPKQNIVKKEYNTCYQLLSKYATLEVYPFPQELDANGLNKHDFVFTRDSFISNQKGKIVISNFSERERQAEAEYRQKQLENSSYELFRLPDNAYAEGGEFYYSPKDDILFSGVCRNNKIGISEVTRLLNIKNVCIVESDSFHLDTVFTILLNSKGKLCGIVVCLELIKNKYSVIAFARRYNLEVIDVLPVDTIGYDGNGKISVNCIALPGVLLGGSTFVTPGVEEKIKRMGIEHLWVPVSQFLLSGGGIHCLTNELLS